MFDIVLWIGAAVWLLALVQLVANAALIPRLSRGGGAAPPVEWPFVSIVVPARNEARDIEAAVTSFCRQDYARFEVVVVDDGSTDDTPLILERLAAQFPNLRVVKGQEPPPGWLGKPNALEQGKRAARGDWLLFVDADVVHEPALTRLAMARVLARDAQMLTVIPRLVTRGVMEPVLLANLAAGLVLTPLFLVARTRAPFFTLGGGPGNLVSRRALEKAGVFESLRDAVVDDIGLGYRVKQAGFRQELAFALDLVRLRMYRGGMEVVRGFGKNTYPAIRKAPYILAAPILFGTVSSLLPYVGAASSLFGGTVHVAAFVSLALSHTVFLGMTILYGQPWFVAFLNPVRELGLWGILAYSFVKYQRHGILWRGRSFVDK